MNIARHVSVFENLLTVYRSACLHGTNARPARGARRHFLQQSSEVDVADDSDAVVVVTAGTGA